MLLRQLRNVMFGRVLQSLPTVGFANANGVPLQLACDTRGALWTRNMGDSLIPSGSVSGHPLWAFSAPAAATAASATFAAVASLRNQINTIAATLSAAGGAQPELNVVVRDGATGVGAIIWQFKIGAVLAGDSKSIVIPNLTIYGTTNTAMCVEFTAAPGAGNFATISINGQIIQTFLAA